MGCGPVQSTHNLLTGMMPVLSSRRERLSIYRILFPRFPNTALYSHECLRFRKYCVARAKFTSPEVYYTFILIRSLTHFISHPTTRNRQHRDQHHLQWVLPIVHTPFATLRLLRRNRCLMGAVRQRRSGGGTKSAHCTSLRLSEIPRMCCSYLMRATWPGATAS